MKLVKAVTASKDGGPPPLPKALNERVPEVAPRMFHSLPADLEARGQSLFIRSNNRVSTGFTENTKTREVIFGSLGERVPFCLWDN